MLERHRRAERLSRRAERIGRLGHWELRLPDRELSWSAELDDMLVDLAGRAPGARSARAATGETGACRT